MATVRNLKIKTGTCKRLVREFHSYEKEVEREAAKTADMKGKGADPYDLKQQENVLAESRMMIPDCRKRLEASLAELKGTSVELEEELNQKKALKLKKLGPLLQKLISCSRQQKPSLPAFVTVTNFPWFSICSDTMCAPNKGRQCCLAIVFQGILVSFLYCYFKHMY